MSVDANGNVTCICKSSFCRVVANDAYPESPGGVFCDMEECCIFVDPRAVVYHCGNSSFHKRGFDMCTCCMERLSGHDHGESTSTVKKNVKKNDKHINNTAEKPVKNINNGGTHSPNTITEEQDEKGEMKNVAALSPQKQLDWYHGNRDSIILTYFYGYNKYYFYAEQNEFGKGFFKKAYRAVMYKSEVAVGANKATTPRIADRTRVVLKKKHRIQDGWQFKNAQPIMNRREWDTDLNELERLGKYCQEWNKNMFSDKTYQASKAFVLKVSDEGMSGAGQFTKGEYLLVEPFMPHFEKWNWPNVAEKFARSFSIQAFGHFTYHYSNGAELVNDAQGYRDDNKYILTDPYYVSGNDPRCREWFKDHKCNKFCKSFWKRPNNVQRKQFDDNFGYRRVDGVRPTCPGI